MHQQACCGGRGDQQRQHQGDPHRLQADHNGDGDHHQQHHAQRFHRQLERVGKTDIKTDDDKLFIEQEHHPQHQRRKPPHQIQIADAHPVDAPEKNVRQVGRVVLLGANHHDAQRKHGDEHQRNGGILFHPFVARHPSNHACRDQRRPQATDEQVTADIPPT